GFRRVATYDGLSKRERLELERLHNEVRQWLVAAGGPRLSRFGASLVAGDDKRSQFFAGIFEHWRSLANKPDVLMADPSFDEILSMVVTNHGERGVFLRTDPLGTHAVMRWAQLSKRWQAERVSVDLRSLRSFAP
ncbi:MAG: hypothetical protein M3Z46_04630, partial [Actinomycetota bacterium]|nr:hypothetical protein [Actinomycetota bacterium]